MIEAFLLSLKVSFLTALILTVVGTPLAYLLAFRRGLLKVVLEAFVISPIVVPPTVLGFYFIYLFRPDSPVGSFVEKLFGKPPLFSFEALVFASVIYSLPFGVIPLRDAFEKIDRRLIEIAYVFGYSRLQTFLKVILPNSVGGFLSSWSLSFAHTMGEFGIVLMVGGNIPGQTQTLSIFIYDAVQGLEYRQAHLASLLLLTSSILTLSLTGLIRWRVR